MKSWVLRRLICSQIIFRLLRCSRISSPSTTYESLKSQFLAPRGSWAELGLCMAPKMYSVTLHKLNICFMLPFQTLQFELFRGSLVWVMAVLSIIETRSTDGTVVTMLTLIEARASPPGVPGTGVNRLVAPVAVLPWFNIGVSFRGRWRWQRNFGRFEDKEQSKWGWGEVSEVDKAR